MEHFTKLIFHALRWSLSYGAGVFAKVSADKKYIVEEYGATALDYRATQVQDYVATNAGGKGFDIAYHTVGGVTLDASS